MLLESSKEQRQVSLKNNHLCFNEEHRKYLAKILSILEKTEGAILSNKQQKQCLKVSNNNSIAMSKKEGKNLYTLSIYTKGSNVRLDMDCKPLNLKEFRKQIKKIRVEHSLGNSK